VSRAGQHEAAHSCSVCCLGRAFNLPSCPYHPCSLQAQQLREEEERAELEEYTFQPTISKMAQELKYSEAGNGGLGGGAGSAYQRLYQRAQGTAKRQVGATTAVSSCPQGGWDWGRACGWDERLAHKQPTHLLWPVTSVLAFPMWRTHSLWPVMPSASCFCYPFLLAAV